MEPLAISLEAQYGSESTGEKEIKNKIKLQNHKFILKSFLLNKTIKESIHYSLKNNFY